MDAINNFLEWAKKNGWNFTLSNNRFELPEEILRRYYNIPKDYLDFISRFKMMVNKTDTAWFLCQDDFLNPPEEGFRWNEFEMMSLEAVESEDLEDWKAEIKNFWDYHLPIVMCVGGGNYEYYAIDITHNKRPIVHGISPEFEETTEVASDFLDFLQKITDGKIVLY